MVVTDRSGVSMCSSVRRLSVVKEEERRRRIDEVGRAREE